MHAGKPLMNGVAEAVVNGAVTGGLMEGAGSLIGKLSGDWKRDAASALEDVAHAVLPQRHLSPQIMASSPSAR